MSYVEPRYPTSEEHQIFIPRLTPQPPPSVAVDDPADAVCVRINAAWVKHVAGYLYGLTRYDAWDGTEAEVLFARQQVMNLLSLLRKGSDCEASMSCQDVLDCLSDQPQWQAGEVKASSDFYMTDAELQNKTNEQVNARATAYDGTPQSIMTDAVNDKFAYWGQNVGWYEAVTAFVQAAFAAKIRQIDQISGIISITQLLVTGLKTLSGGGWILSALGLAIMPADLMATYGGEVFKNLLNDPMILYHTIDGIARENGNKAVSRAGFTALTGNGYAWRDTTYQGMATIKNWLNAEVLNHPIQGDKNYLLMLSAVHTANHHKVNLGDPMWDGRNNVWTLKRGKNLSVVGVQMLDGTVNTTAGFTFRTSGVERHLELVLSSPNQAGYNTFSLGGANAGLTPIRPTEIQIYGEGVLQYDNTNNYPNNSFYYYGMNAYGNWLRFKAKHEESGQWTLPDPHTFETLTVTGTGKPPVGYWTPD